MTDEPLWVDMATLACVLNRPRPMLSALLSLTQPKIPRLRRGGSEAGRAIWYRFEDMQKFLVAHLPWYDASLQIEMLKAAKLIYPTKGNVF